MHAFKRIRKMNKLKQIFKWIFFLPVNLLIFSLSYTITSSLIAYGYGLIYDQKLIIVLLSVAVFSSFLIAILFYLNLFSAYLADIISPSIYMYFLSLTILMFTRLRMIFTYSPTITYLESAIIIDIPKPIIVIVSLIQLTILIIYGILKIDNSKTSQTKTTEVLAKTTSFTASPSYNPINFPTLVKYDQEKIEEAVQKLMTKYSMTRHQAMVNLEQDLREMEN